MIIVAGHLVVDAAGRAAYLQDCEQVVRLARAASGCLDFALSPDLLDDARINIYERWESRPQLDDFRGSGPTDAQNDAIVSADVQEFDVPVG